MSDKDMPLESRIVKRGSRYSFRAAVPGDVREFIQGGKSGQKWISLRTSDYTEAKRRARIRSVEFDEEVETIRRQQREGLDPNVTVQSRQEVDAETAFRIANEWLQHWLEEDDQRRDGCRKDDETYLANLEDLKKRGVTVEASFSLDDAQAKFGMSERSFEKQRESTEWLLEETRRAIAKRNLEFIEGEVDEWLTCQGIELEAGSLGWRRVARDMLKAQEAALTVIQARNKGKDIRTDQALPSAATSPQTAGIQPQKAPLPLPSSQPQVTLDELIEQYMTDPAKVRAASTQKTYVTVFRALREILGGDRLVNDIDRQDCLRVRDHLLRLPKNAVQRFPGKSIYEVADEADRQQLERIAPKTVNAHLTNMASLFNWAEKEWKVTRNPAKGLKVVDPIRNKDKRRAFTSGELQKIFSAPLYTGCVDDEAGYAQRGGNRPKRGRFWVPILSLFTGMRSNECCQLLTIDVTERDGIPIILITDDNNEGDEADKKRIKTKAGRRFVPVHPTLQRIGFLDFAAAQKRKDKRRLFPELKADKLGYFSGPFGKWFNDKRRFLGKLGIDDPRVSFHSFRHNYRDAMREAGLGRDAVRSLGGWVSGSDGEEERYGDGLSAASLYKEVQRIAYPDLDLSHLFPK